MSLSTKFSIDTTRVLSEVIDGEALVIDLGSGLYFGFNRSATIIWDMLENGLSLQTIQDIWQERFPDCQDIPTECNRFLKHLEQENLIHSTAKESQVLIDKSTFASLDHLTAFAIPEFTKYEDMASMLLADPIHDVSVAGWPHQNPLVREPGQ